MATDCVQFDRIEVSGGDFNLIGVEVDGQDVHSDGHSDSQETVEAEGGVYGYTYGKMLLVYKPRHDHVTEEPALFQHHFLEVT